MACDKGALLVTISSTPTKIKFHFWVSVIGGSVGFRTRSSSDVVTAQVPEFSGVVWFAAESSFGAHVGAGLAFIVPQTEDLVAVVDLQPSFLLYYAVRVFRRVAFHSFTFWVVDGFLPWFPVLLPLGGFPRG